MSSSKKPSPMPSPTGPEKERCSVSTPKSVRRLRVLSERTPANHQRGSPYGLRTPLYSPINRKYATVTPHPKWTDIRRSQRLSKTGIPQRVLALEGSGQSAKKNRSIPRIFVDVPEESTASKRNNQSFETPSTSLVLYETKTSTSMNCADNSMDLSASVCNMQNFVTADMTKAFNGLDEVTGNDDNNRKFEEIEHRIDALQGKADREETEMLKESLKELEGQIEKMGKRILDLEASQQVSETTLADATQKLELLEAQLKKPEQNSSKVTRKKRTSSLSELPRTSDFSELRGKSNIGRPKLPKVAKRPSTVPKPFSFSIRDEKKTVKESQSTF